MRHGKRFNHLGRTASHRKAMLSNMASSLILHKRITTTVAKAKALRQYVEPLITKSKTDTTHNRRVVFSYLQDKESVKILFDEISEKVSDRPGGYTRIIKTGNRLGDNAEMCIMELVDYNLLLLEEKEPKKTRRRRGRKGKKSEDVKSASSVAKAEVKTEQEEQDVAEQPEEVKEEKKEEKQEASAETAVEEKVEAKTETEAETGSAEESSQGDGAEDKGESEEPKE